MKKLSLSLVLLLLPLLLCACALFSDHRVETLNSCSFQYNEGTDDYSVFFALLDRRGKGLAADVDADIRIVDENGNELYSATRSVTKKDFATYSRIAAGEKFLANVRIEASEMAEGTSASGTVYLTIHKNGVVWFDGVDCAALFCLPVKGVTVNAESLPVEVAVKDYSGKTESIIRIDDVTCDFDSGIIPTLSITLSGVKTYASSKSDYGSSFDMIRYKLYDSGGYVVDSGSIILSSLAEGDRFRDESILLFDVKPGESYTLKLMEYDW